MPTLDLADAINIACALGSTLVLLPCVLFLVGTGWNERRQSLIDGFGDAAARSYIEQFHPSVSPKTRASFERLLDDKHGRKRYAIPFILLCVTVGTGSVSVAETLVVWSVPSARPGALVLSGITVSAILGAYVWVAGDHIMHHSPSWPKFVLGMSNRTRTLVHNLIVTAGLRIVLTGHAHQVGGLLQTVKAGAGAHQFLEARCGTTTQRDVFPPPWNPRQPPPEPNALLVHRLVERTRGGPIDWNVEVYGRTSRGFVPSTHRIPGFFGPATIQAWP